MHTPLSSVLSQFRESEATWAHEKVGSVGRGCMARITPYALIAGMEMGYG